MFSGRPTTCEHGITFARNTGACRDKNIVICKSGSCSADELEGLTLNSTYLVSPSLEYAVWCLDRGIYVRQVHLKHLPLPLSYNPFYVCCIRFPPCSMIRKIQLLGLSYLVPFPLLSIAGPWCSKKSKYCRFLSDESVIDRLAPNKLYRHDSFILASWSQIAARNTLRF